VEKWLFGKRFLTPHAITYDWQTELKVYAL
jgi:hypothetical protein